MKKLRLDNPLGGVRLLGVLTLAGGLSTSPLPAQDSAALFDSVVGRLDKGGDFLLYWNATETVEAIERFKDGIFDLMDSEESRDSDARIGMSLVDRLFETIGVSEFQAIGASEMSLSDGTRRNRIVFSRGDSRGDGLMWNLLGDPGASMRFPRLAPKSTALAGYSDVDLKRLWSTFNEFILNSGIDDLEEEFAEAFQEISEEIDLEAILDSLGRGVGMALTLNPEKQIPLPIPVQAGQDPFLIPELGILLHLGVTNSALVDLVLKNLKAEGAPVESSDYRGTEIHVVKLPIPLPVTVAPTMFHTKDGFFLCLNPEVARASLDAAEDERQSLFSNPDFNRLAADWDRVGAKLAFVGPQVGELLHEVREFALERSGIGAAELGILQSLQGGNDRPLESLGVVKVVPSGFEYEGRSSASLGSAALFQVGMAQVGVLGAITLPALSKAKDRAKTAQCANHLKQISIAAHLNALEHDDKFPTSFDMMKGALGSANALVCPSDPNFESNEAFTWEDFENGREPSYILHSGPDVNAMNPGSVLLECPFHDHKAFCDGSVRDTWDE